MSHLHNVNEQVDNNLNNENCSILDESRRNLRLQSFVDRYGIEEPEISSIDHAKQYARKKCSSLSLECCTNTFLNKIPLIRCLKEYNIRKNLFGDIVSGITVAIMHIPQGKKRFYRLQRVCISIVKKGMAYGALTTLPPVHGDQFISYFQGNIFFLKLL